MGGGGKEGGGVRNFRIMQIRDPYGNMKIVRTFHFTSHLSIICETILSAL